ncbi:glycosyltransferase [Sphingomonas sp. Leaf4]|uniref:glycosyltransferase n=1 Tax=Sphingomonas sp. Leaf4 TaxID=2876553 RepID=UPI001E565A42|nr:glycosyltransferase [Sphingomonas sp. Leaf4]
MRIVALFQEFPFPANNGMRSDISRRLATLHALGHEVHAIAWTGGRLDPVLRDADVTAAARLTASLDVLPIDRGWRRVANLARFPSQVAGRWPTAGDRHALLDRLRARVPAPDCVWVDGIHAGALGRWLARALGVPLLYRSHNIEHRYLAEQARLARGRTRWRIAANVLGMRRFETALQRDAAQVFEISADDRDWWRGRGIAHNRWLPPQPDPMIASHSADGSRSIDLFFVGSLSSPNNQAGLAWYLGHVHPLVRDALPDVRVVIAGRSPPSALLGQLGDAGIETLPDPAAVAPLVGRAHVLMNPIHHGSGVNIKTIDMLASGRPVVTTAKGARGLPPAVVDHLILADDPSGFAAALVAAIHAARSGERPHDRSALIETHFGHATIARALAEGMAALSPRRTRRG